MEETNACMMYDKNTTNTSASEDTIATILIGTQHDEDHRTTSNMPLWRKGVTNLEMKEERRSEQVQRQRQMVKNDAPSSHHHADDTTSTGESSSSSIMEDEEQQQAYHSQRQDDDDDDDDLDEQQQDAFVVVSTTDDNATNPTAMEHEQESQLSVQETNVRNKNSYFFVIGPALMIGSMVLFLTPLIWDFVIHLSTYTWFCLGIFGIGFTQACVTMVSIFKDQFQFYQTNILHYLDHVVLDNVLEQVIQGAAITLMSISSLMTMYLLPISQDCRGELLDSSVGPILCRQHGWASNDCTCANKIYVSDILLKQGGLRTLWKNYLSCSSRITTTTSSSTPAPLLILSTNEAEHDDDDDDDDESNNDMVWNDHNNTTHHHHLAVFRNNVVETTTTLSTRRNINPTPTIPTFDAALRRAMRECCQAILQPIYIDVTNELKQQRVRLFWGFFALIGVRHYSKNPSRINQIFMRCVLQPLLQRTRLLLLLRNRTKHNQQQTAATATAVVVLAAAAAAIMRRRYNYCYSKEQQRIGSDTGRTTSSLAQQQQQQQQLLPPNEEDGPLSSASSYVVVQRQRSSTVAKHDATKVAATSTSSPIITALSSLLTTTTTPSQPLLLRDKLKEMLLRLTSSTSCKRFMLLLLAYAIAARRKHLLLKTKGGT